LPSREKIEGARKYMIINKAAGADSIAAELLKNGGSNLTCSDPVDLDLRDTSEELDQGFVFSVQEEW
jgi:hypothetical protein